VGSGSSVLETGDIKRERKSLMANLQKTHTKGQLLFNYTEPTVRGSSAHEVLICSRKI